MVSLLPYLLLVWLPIAAIANTFGRCDSCTRATAEQLANISIRLYSNNIDTYTTVSIGSATDLLDSIDPTKPTVLYISGWTETPDSESVHAVLGAYIELDDHNILLLDWSDIAGGSYLSVFMSVDTVGETLANALNEMVAAGLDSSTIHVVGHSMGAHMAGFMGLQTDFTVPRITGLDPAGPGFYVTKDHLNANCGKIVDVIHTDAGIYGSVWPDATANFYPNFGTRIQPGCTFSLPLSGDDFCSHKRSWEFYAESVVDKEAFVAAKCESPGNWMRNDCTETEIMGYGMSDKASGLYYLQTNNASPYGLGTAGSTFSLTLFEDYLTSE